VLDMPSARPEPSRRGGKRPGAGAPRGNTNALVSGRYSKGLSSAAICLPRAIPAYRDHLASVSRRDHLEGRRLLARYIVAAELAVQRTPNLADDIITAIFVHRRRAARVETGEVLLGIISQLDQSLTLHELLAVASWFIRRDPVIAEALITVIQPPFEAALETLYATAPIGPEDAENGPNAEKTIKQSNRPHNSNLPRPEVADCPPSSAPKTAAIREAPAGPKAPV
jgi:hypothetical protein